MSSTLEADIARLQATVSSLLSLISHCQASISILTAPAPSPTSTLQAPSAAITTTTATAPESTIPPLSLLHDTASLARAHTTKLALLLTQHSLSATAAATIKLLSTIQTSIVPPLLTSLELLHSHGHARVLLKMASVQVGQVLHGIAEMLAGPLKKTLQDAQANKGENRKVVKDTVTLPSTGKIWAACDALIGLQENGLVGVVSSKLKICQETISDATEELKKYIDKCTPSVNGTSSSSGDHASDGDDAEGEDDDFWDDEDDFPSTSLSSHIPKKKRARKPLPPHILMSMNASLKRLKTISIILQTIKNHRLAVPSTVPRPDPAHTVNPDKRISERLDGMATTAEEIVALVDDVVGGYYDLDGEDEEDSEEKGKEAQKELKPSATEQELIQKAIELVELGRLTWKGQEDEITRLFDACGKSLQK
ncbi:hypothetical protein BDZ91DRAFT_710519 [Kalaharituber pfeilii]|nr:hypothetical protein BDZ91DRAFT_710519 [Kalaharituber pfeilii]